MQRPGRVSGIGRGLLALALVVPAVCAAEVAAADADAARNRVSFGVERSREVENDWVTATLSATHEDADPAAVADRINRDMTWALGLAKAKTGLRVRTGGYRTVPKSDPQRGVLRRWRGSQELVLETADATAMSALVGELQARLQVRSLGFSVSPERRREVEAELIDAALAAFQERAARVSKGFGAKNWTLVQVNVDGGGPPPGPMRVHAMGAQAEMAAPALEGGSSRLRAGARGTIELQF